jgi:signal transduction histidine kinase
MGQISLVILGAVLLYQVAVIVVFQAMESEGKRHYVSEADYVTEILISLNGVPLWKRGDQAIEIMASAPYLRILLQENAPERSVPSDLILEAEIKRINQHLRGGLTAFSSIWPGANEKSIAAMFPGGGYCLVSIDQEKKPAKLLWRWITDPEPALPLVLTRWPRAVLLYLICVSVVLMWAVKSIVFPIIALSREMRAASLDGDYSMNIRESGAEEIRELIRSVNEMHRKIFDMARHRRYALAALSHDLKTILTRLKLRVEFISEDALRGKFREDFDLMDTMVQRKLEFLRAEGSKSDYVLVDISSLIETVADQFREEAAKIRFAGAHGICVETSVSDLFRILTNVLANAVKFAENIEVSVLSVGDEVLIEVADDGPGIRDDLKGAVFEPFVRGNPEQTLEETGGFGLGLSIVRALLDRQGGKIKLVDNTPNGLIVRLVLPKMGRQLER